ncbi:hypothetical protein Misp01_11560 [Microtetraspora sp. NBRC 13810]|uniref:amidohydrolase family protein n=1 Tax=Microtetraspora sp. NBRC 13810 TaxID=3030990 RepID=UPI0024A06A48|nr:amidohydrolase family protein [Microtetraspora sp. NBRC 13810]GLW06026.1 hypothetical protein Misp01_11560 [Microtetraspora sp. NBRC 13810]
MSVDVHQHVWTPELLDALRRRAAAPRLDGWTLHLDGEPPYEVDPLDHDVPRRTELNRDLDLALVSLSSPLGVEHLPPGEAWPIIDAYHAGALALPAPFRAWAATCVADPDPDRLRRDLDRGLVGLQVPATAMLDAAGLDRLAGVLDVLAERDRPLFVHPGPAAARGVGEPGWWAAVVPYVQQMHAAWYAFHAYGRPRHAGLRVCFALLAGLAPLHLERVITRGGAGRGQIDTRVYVETSSYGPRAIDAVVRELGIDVVVNGSDLPYASAPPTGLGAAADHAIHTVNPYRLLGVSAMPGPTRKESHP